MPKISSQRIETFFLIFLFATAVFVRFWQIRDYVVFLGDEGRDMLVMRHIFTERHLPFLGPTASVGGFYLGPIYYWMAAPFLLVWRFDPIGPSYMVALFGLATVFVLYKLLKEIVGFWPAATSALLYSTAPLIVRYSRSSWNPNPLPFFSLLSVYFLYKATLGKLKYFLFVGLCFGIAIQLHYLSSIMLAVYALVIIFVVSPRRWLKATALFLVGSAITLSPFLIFELRHGFPNTHTIYDFATRGTTIGYKSPNLPSQILNTANVFLSHMTMIKSVTINTTIFWILSLGGIYGILKYWNFTKRWIFLISLIWFIGGLAGIRSYGGQVFDYYFGFMFPAPFLILGLVVAELNLNRILKTLTAVFILAALIWFYNNSFFKKPPSKILTLDWIIWPSYLRIEPNRLIYQTETVSNFVIEKTENRPFNFALISDHNSDHAYRYFLEIKNHKPKELEEIVTDQLLVVCESKTCAPLGHSIWEVAGFGRAEIASLWEIPDIGIKVFRLTHWPGELSPAGRPAKKG